jgi:hypothetical protein
MPAKASAVTERIAVKYCKHEFPDPVDLVTFVRLGNFTSKWKRLRLDDLDMKVMRGMIAAAPKSAPVVPGTGGVRKIRFGRHSSNRGKSAGVRVCYAYFEGCSLVLLIGVYAKNQKADLSAAERRDLKKEIQEFEKSLESGPLR